MAIRSRKNLYPGVNPHLNSALQRPAGGWKGFHTRFLSRLGDALEPLLPDAYYVANEQSLQVGIYDVETDLPLDKPRLSVPDLTIYRSGKAGQEVSEQSHSTPFTMIFPLPETVAERDTYVASVVIYRTVEGEYPGEPVTRIELLSPANKQPGSDYGAYITKRDETLYSHVRLVEIDLLHERRPILSALPSYIDNETGAFPYYFIVSDPRPTFQRGMAGIIGVSVLAPLPIMDIPLDGTDTVIVDFGTLYRETMENSRLFRSILVDYAQSPERFQTYTPDDQQRIRDHMAAIAANPPVDESAIP